MCLNLVLCGQVILEIAHYAASPGVVVAKASETKYVDQGGKRSSSLSESLTLQQILSWHHLSHGAIKHQAVVGNDASLAGPLARQSHLGSNS